ncbi:MAG: QueT transporter family protein [Clostridiaceae bacterium]|nr:QueT transporter family protein [Clostridiaceae bacterium]
MKNKKVYSLVTAALIAAMYVALTYFSNAFGLAYGEVQFRLSEVLMLFAVYTPAAIPGLTIGCFLGNLGSPFGMVDIICGTCATLLAAVCIYLTRRVQIKKFPVLFPIFTALFNAVIVGAEISFFMPEGFTFYGMLVSGAFVGLGELVVTLVLGIPLNVAIIKTKIKEFFN